MQSMRRSRNVLVELMIAVLFLAIAACVLAQLFAAAWETGEESRSKQASLLIARDTLEMFSAGEVLPEAWPRSVDGRMYDVSADVTAQDTPEGTLHTCRVTVCTQITIYADLESTSYTMEARQDDEI